MDSVMSYLPRKVVDQLVDEGRAHIDRKADVCYVGEDALDPRPGEMHDIDQAFYSLTIKERDYERMKVDRLERTVAELEEQRDDLLDYVKNLEGQLGIIPS